MAVNGIIFLSMGRDKLAAASGLPRTPELSFFTLEILGGFPGLLLGRMIFNHKTSKVRFIIPMWLLFLAQVGALVWYYSPVSRAEQQTSAQAENENAGLALQNLQEGTQIRTREVPSQRQRNNDELSHIRQAPTPRQAPDVRQAPPSQRLPQ